MAKVSGHDLGGGISRRFVREMPMPPQNALFEAPGPPGTVLQHLDIVIRFQQEHIRGADTFEHKLRRMPKVREESNIAGGSAEKEADRILGVMGDRKRFNCDIPDVESRARREEAAIEPNVQLLLDCILRGTVTIDRDTKLFGQCGQALDVIRMFVRDQNAGQFLGCPRDRSQALANLAEAETGVYKKAGFIGLDVAAISG
jgi:hypothetical protein